MSGVLSLIDLARQARRGAAFVLGRESGGTGNDEGRGHGVIQDCNARSSVTQWAPVAFAVRSGGTGETVIVEPVDATTDLVMGIAQEAPAADFGTIPVLTMGVTRALVSGTIAVGDLLYPTAAGRLSATKTTAAAVARALQVSSTDTTAYVYLDAHPWRSDLAVILAVFSGGGSAIQVNEKHDIPVKFDCVIEEVEMLADQNGSIVVDVQRDSYANYPPTGADSICAAAKPTISATNKSRDSTLTGWSKSLTAGQTLRFNVDSVTAITRCSVALVVRKV